MNRDGVGRFAPLHLVCMSSVLMCARKRVQQTVRKVARKHRDRMRLRPQQRSNGFVNIDPVRRSRASLGSVATQLRVVYVLLREYIRETCMRLFLYST